TEDLRSTTKPMRRFTRGSLPSAIDPMADVRALADALQLPRPPAVMECFDISNISTTHVVASMVCFRDGVPDKDCYRRYRVRTVEGQDDFASMAEVVRRRYSRVLLSIAECGSRNSEREDVDLSPQFSQENAFEMARRARSCHVEVCRGSPARFDHRGWRQGTTVLRVPRIAAAWSARSSDHWSGQGT
ncbi:MAG: hypothetical protein DMF25_10560, partial [Verrucomicrobia bacterium]